MYTDQRNAQVFNVFLPISQSSKAGVQLRQWFKSLGTVLAPGSWHHTQETWTTAEIVHLPLKMC
jgi:hypothetical protein